MVRSTLQCNLNQKQQLSFHGISSLAAAEACHQVLRSRHIGTQPKQVANCDKMRPEKGLPNLRLVHLSTHTSVELSESLTRTDGRLRRKCAWKDLTNFCRPLKTEIKQVAYTKGESKQPRFIIFGALVYINNIEPIKVLGSGRSKIHKLIYGLCCSKIHKLIYGLCCSILNSFIFFNAHTTIDSLHLRKPSPETLR